MYEIIPAILEKEWNEIERKINLVKPFAKTIHIDLIDGKFAPQTTFLDPSPFQEYTQDLFFELHMMVDDPIQYLKPWADAGFKRFLGHVEKMPDQEEFVAQGQLLGEVGLAIDTSTPIGAIKVYYDDLDCLLLMCVKAGESGQKFNQEQLKKVEMLKLVQHDMVIEVDGGINDQTIMMAKDSGAKRFSVNSFLFKAKDLNANYLTLESLLE